MPCGEVCADVCFCVNFDVVVRIGVRHGVFLRIVEKICGWDLGRSVLTWVFDPRVVRLGDGRVHAYHDFVSGWLDRHGFRCRGGSSCCKNFRDRRFEYPVGLCAGKRVMSSCSVATSTKHATIVVCCACTNLPGVPKVLSG